MRPLRHLLLLTLVSMSVACGGDDGPVVYYPGTADGGSSASDAVGAGEAGDASADGAATDVAAGVDAGTPEDATSSGDVGAEGPPLSYSGGTCPRLGAGLNTIASGPGEREFEVYLPGSSAGAPLVFFWYGAGGSTQTYEWMQSFADAHGVAIVVPRAVGSGGMMDFEWPILPTNNPANEFVFFEDIAACSVSELGLDGSRIYTSGFSAGALWSTILVMERSDLLAAALIFSGGTGGQFLSAYTTPAVSIPVLGVYGGSGDNFGGGLVNFESSMTEFMDALTADGHLVVSCDHGGGHTVPAGGFDWGIEFLLGHRYSESLSPFAETLPASLPAYCDYWQ